MLSKKYYFNDISQVMSNFLCLYSYHGYFILSLKSEKRVQKEIKDCAFRAYLFNKETSS